MSGAIGQIFGNYHLIRLIGRGGFAEVYLGEHRHLGTLAAVKILHSQLSQEDSDSFNREARMIAQLDHPHLVRVLDFNVEHDIPFFVMEYAPNGSMRKRHPRGTPLALPTVVSYVQQIASALQYIHDRQLIHRDIKPDNILLRADESLMVSDFGIATIAHQTASIKIEAMAGTVTYMAPEQMNGKPRVASDQYALAIAVFEWLAGQVPFRGTTMEIAMQHATKQPPSLTEIVPTIPSTVDDVLTRALAKDPKARFPTIEAFAQALEQAAHQPSPSAHPSISVSTDLPLISASGSAQAPPSPQKTHIQRNATTPSEEKTEPLTNKAITLTPTLRVPSLNGIEILRRVDENDIPANWFVARRNYKKFMLTLFGRVVLILLFLYCLLLVILAEAFSIPGSVVIAISVFVIFLILLGLRMHQARSLWKRAFQYYIFVLTPDGFVEGNLEGYRVGNIVNFSDVLAFSIKRRKLSFTIQGARQKSRGVALPLKVFAAPDEVKSRLVDAFNAYQKHIKGA